MKIVSGLACLYTVCALLLFGVKPAFSNVDTPVFEAFRGAIGKKANFTMMLRRNGGKLTGIYFYDLTRIDIKLDGEIATDGSFRLTERANSGKESASFTGKWTLDNLSGNWAELTGRRDKPPRTQPFTAQKNTTFIGIGNLGENTYDGFMGDKYTIRMALAIYQEKLSGYYRYRNSKQDLKLEGKVSADGTFELTERDPQGKVTGSFSGLFVPGVQIFGEWRNVERTQNLLVRLWVSGIALRKTVVLDRGIRLVPRELTSENNEDFVAVGEYYEVTGLADAAVARKINTFLEQAARKRTECTDSVGSEVPGCIENFELNDPLLLGKFLVFSQFHDEDDGGTHPVADGASLVLDLETGCEVDLLSYLKPGKAEAFSQSVEEKVQEQEGESVTLEKSLKSAHIYPRGNGMIIRFSPYEVGAYDLGFVETTLSTQEAREFFKANADTRVLFGI